MENQKLSELITYLKTFVSDARWDTMNENLDQRTRHLTVVLEDIYQPHNASAVLRSCDGFGIQDVHIIENRNQFDASSQVTIGADQWLSLHRYNQEGRNNTALCFDDLKAKGYQVLVTTPHENDSNIQDVDVSKPTAIVFGSEVEGVSEEALKLADGFVKIPMYGFSESFNISVSAAICMYDLTTRLRNTPLHWQLAEDERQELLYEWVKNSIKAGEQLSQKFLREYKS